jgi:glycosyltransferase involved in cell wall biosynthesis
MLFPQFLTAASRRYYNDQIKWAVGKADLISADSHATADDLAGRLGVPRDKIMVIHLGVDPEFTPEPPAGRRADAAVLGRLGLAPGYVLCVGTFEPRKNIGGLMDAYKLLRHAAPDAPPLVLVGRAGWLFDDTASKIDRLGLSDQVRRIEDLPSADLPAVYRGAGVLALPSHYEGFGFPVLEAMACGTPAVIANRASLPEIAGGAALSVEPDDHSALAAALHQALSDSTLRADLIERGLVRAREFTWQRTAEETLGLYQRALAL